MRFAALLLMVPATFACASSASTGDEVLMNSADAALFVGHSCEQVFWDLPRLIVWEAPKGLLYDLPRKGYLSLSSRAAQAAALIDMLQTEAVTVEEQVAVSEELQAVTGLPLHSSESWQRWWSHAGDRPAKEWKDAFVSERIERLTAADYFVRASASDDLSAIFGTTLGYDPKHLPPALRSGADIWRRRFQAKTLPDPAPGPF